ncbi:hypothetical protein Esti_006740 [Eimeria stiedai]
MHAVRHAKGNQVSSLLANDITQQDQVTEVLAEHLPLHFHFLLIDAVEFPAHAFQFLTCVANESGYLTWNTGKCGQPTGHRVVGFLSSRSHLHGFGSSLSGIRLRRLGESESEADGDLSIPPSPDLAELYYSVGDWTPDFPSHGGPRASPDLVEAVLASVDWTPDFPLHGGPRASPDLVEAVLASAEAEDESGGKAASQPALAIFDSSLGAFVSGTGVKRLLPEDHVNEAEGPGPSSKIARMHSPTTVEQTSLPELVHFGDQECQTGQRPSAQPAAGPALGDPPSTFGSACQPSASSSTVPALDEGASTSLGASGRLAPLVHERDPPQKHPFVRLPVL